MAVKGYPLRGGLFALGRRFMLVIGCCDEARISAWWPARHRIGEVRRVLLRGRCGARLHALRWSASGRLWLDDRGH